MRRKDAAVLLAGAAMLMGIGGISIMCADYAKKRGGGEGITSFVFGGRAELRNVIEIPLSEVEKLALDYRSKNIRVYSSKEDTVVIREYLYSDREEARASLTWSGEKEATVTGGSEKYFVLFGLPTGEGERVEVCIPDKSLKAFSLRTGSGNISAGTDMVLDQGSLTAQTGSGNIKWENAREQEICLQTGSGNIRMENMKGDMTVHTGSGNITGESLEGNLQAGTGSGNVKLEGFRGGGKMEAGSGNVTVEMESLEGDLSLWTKSGNVRLKLARDQAFHFQAQTGSGGINTDFEQALSFNKKGNQASGDVGQAPAWTVDARTGSGNVTVHYR